MERWRKEDRGGRRRVAAALTAGAAALGFGAGLAGCSPADKDVTVTVSCVKNSGLYTQQQSLASVDGTVTVKDLASGDTVSSVLKGAPGRDIDHGNDFFIHFNGDISDGYTGNGLPAHPGGKPVFRGDQLYKDAHITIYGVQIGSGNNASAGIEADCTQFTK